jgi:hypothetical protein
VLALPVFDANAQVLHQEDRLALALAAHDQRPLRGNGARRIAMTVMMTISAAVILLGRRAQAQSAEKPGQRSSALCPLPSALYGSSHRTLSSVTPSARLFTSIAPAG